MVWCCTDCTKQGLFGCPESKSSQVGCTKFCAPTEQVRTGSSCRLLPRLCLARAPTLPPCTRARCWRRARHARCSRRARARASPRMRATNDAPVVRSCRQERSEINMMNTTMSEMSKASEITTTSEKHIQTSGCVCAPANCEPKRPRECAPLVPAPPLRSGALATCYIRTRRATLAKRAAACAAHLHAHVHVQGCLDIGLCAACQHRCRATGSRMHARGLFT